MTTTTESSDPVSTGVRSLPVRRTVVAWAALAAVYVLWGSTYNAIRLGDQTIPPLVLAGTRYLLAGTILLPIAARGGPAPWRLPRAQWRSAFLTGLLMLAGGNALVTVSERTIPAGVAALLVATVPIWLVLFQAVLARRRPGAVVVGAVLLGVAGVGVLVGPSGGHVDLMGAATILLAAALWAAGSLHSRSSEQPPNPFLAAAMQMLGGGGVILAAALATGEFRSLSPEAVGWSGALALAWLIVPGSLVGLSAYVLALRALPVPVVSTYAFVNPLVAVAIGALFFGEPLTLQVAASAAIIVGAVVLLLVGRWGAR